MVNCMSVQTKHYKNRVFSSKKKKERKKKGEGGVVNDRPDINGNWL